MAVLPWGHSRNHTSSSTEKSKASSLDWFSRSAAEPSRQAINQLMKQTPRGGSGGSVNLRARSRAGTPSSQQSSHRSTASVDSRPERTASVIVVKKSTSSSSRPATPVRPSTSSIDPLESASKSLFQKGGLLRRKGSKIGMNFPISPASGIVSPPRPTSRAGLRGRDATASPTKDDSRRPSISSPFDFAHVMHGDIGSFTGLGSIDESDLASQFDAIQARYRITTETGSPLPLEPETLTPTQRVEQVQAPTPTPASPSTPTTPAPAPPPKDTPPAVQPAPTDVRASRSTENFSRPTPRSPTTSVAISPLRPSSCHLQHLTSCAAMTETMESTQAKPLPQLPTVIHAVSTEDDTARLLISAPLPAPPANCEKAIPRHRRQSSSRSSLRHMSSFPSARHPQTSASVQEGQLLGIKEEDVLSRPHSDYELSHRTHRNRSIDQGSESLKVEDWEVAIDSAWDFEDEADVQDGMETSFERRESLLTIEQPQPDPASSPSTPLMTMAPTGHSRSRPDLQRPPSVMEDSDEGHRNSTALVGLGIETDSRAETPVRASRLPTLEVVTSDTKRINPSPRLARSAYSAISHASSQESIILSIASSIISTQRSSISSVSVSEFAHTSKSDRFSIPNSSTSPLLTVDIQKAARPESTCLPTALLQQMNIEAQKVARPDSTCLPSISPSKRSSVISKTDRPESVCLPQDMLATFPIPETTSRCKTSSVDQSSKVEMEDDEVADLPTDELKRRSNPAARNSTSNRVLSNLSGDNSPVARRRSSTQNSRTRNARVSYSLFPNAAAPSAATPLHSDSDIVAT